MPSASRGESSPANPRTACSWAASILGAWRAKYVWSTCRTSRVGQYVLVHVGFALSKIDAAEAQKIFQLLLELDQLSELAPDAEGDPRSTAP